MKTSYLASRLANIGNWQELAVQSHYRAEHFARLCNVSPRTLQRYFQKQLRTSPQRWLDQGRQFQAELLINTGERTKQIANLLGYENASDFCHQFKRHHGLSAKQWRDQTAKPPIRAQRADELAIERHVSLIDNHSQLCSNAQTLKRKTAMREFHNFSSSRKNAARIA